MIDFRKTFFCSDGFYPDPDKVRVRLLSGKFERHNNGFTGLECDLKEDISDVMKSIATRLGYSIDYFSPAQGKFRSLTTLQERMKVRNIHVDRMGLTALVYLSKSEKGGGTSFYRHRETGLYGFHNSFDLLLAALREGKSVEQLVASIENDFSDESKFEEVHFLPYSFNRLAVFDSNVFHAAGKGFGTTIKNSKLTQNFNFWRSNRLKIWRKAVLRRAKPDLFSLRT